MPNPHKPFRMPENIQKTIQKRKCSGKASESRKRTNKKVRQNEKLTESKTTFESAFGHVPCSDNTLDVPNNRVEPQENNPPNPSATLASISTNKNDMIESDDDASFAFRFNGADPEDSDDEENFNDDANMPGNLPSPNIGFGGGWALVLGCT